ncbi:MAG: hypothetical protein INR73_26900 [Williamsia sp.]|nr:hypothetical protein [Williamsia sp.]
MHTSLRHVKKTAGPKWTAAQSCLKQLIPFLLLLIALHHQALAQQPAFPGAEGGGKYTSGGRGGTVYEVTNLNDAGPGSLRDAVSVANRTIVFRVSGIIRLQSRLVIRRDNITIAGQTAPGDGICIAGYTLNLNASNIVLRYLRCRLGDETGIEDDAMNGFAGTISYQNILIDHCSLSWSVDETGTFYGVKDFTLQWCILSESMYHSVHDKGDHGYAGIWGGQNASFHHNLLAHHTSRCPRFCGSRYTGRPDLETVDFRNNVIYNWGNINSTYGGEGGNYNMVNNYYKPGPATPGSLSASSTSNLRNRILNYTSYYYATDSKIYPDTLFGGKFYVNGNWVDGYPDVSADNWTRGVQKDSYAKADSLMAAARQNAPFPFSDVTTQSAQGAYQLVLDGAGATLPRRDPIDKRIVNEARTGTATYEGSTYAAINRTGISHPSGIIDTQTDAGGWPAYNSTPAPADTDHDGMPDDWETLNGLNPNDANDRNGVAPDGYTMLEKYLNSIAQSSPDIVVNGTLNPFSQTTGTPSAAQTYTVSGSNLTGGLTITPPANFEVSADGGSHWYNQGAPLVLTQSGGSVNATIAARLNAGAGGNYSGNIVHTSAGAYAVNMPVKGSTITPAPDGTAVVVAQDGSGNYTTVQAAIDAAPAGRTTPYIIFIRNGRYREKLTIPANKPFLQLMGESVANTIISWDDYNGKANPAGGVFGTSNSATVTVNANDFLAANISFENATGYTGDGPQALAINVNSDRAVFKNCRFTGGQDTLLANGNGKRQYFRNCYIDGNTDFIFGSAIAVFDSCVIYPRDRVDGSSGGYVTAANTPAGQAYGYVFRDCRITVNRGVTNYTLGRPWQNDASTADAAKSNNKVVFLNTVMGPSIRPEGWSVWDAGTDVSKITYAEYKTKRFDGSLADISQRASWSKQLSDAEAAAYYNNPNLFGNWDPCTLSTFVCTNSTSDIAVSNFRAKKGNATVPSVITWNTCWAQTGISYELYRSTDRSNFTRLFEQTAINDTAVNFLYQDAVPTAGNTYYYFVKASKSGWAAHITDTISVSSTPTIVLGGTLGAFAQTTGTPSAAQAYTVSGTNLTDNVVIVPPAGYEISSNGGTNWINNTSSIVLAPTAGVLSATTITVRLNAAAAGTYSGNIGHTSTGALAVNQAVTGSTGDAPPASSVVLVHWPLTASGVDSAAVRAKGVTAGTPLFGRFALSDSTTLPGYPAYNGVNGQSFAPLASGLWTTAAPGPGGNLNRTFYEQFTISAATSQVRVDSIVLSTAFVNTASNTKLGVVYSKTGFTTADSTNVTGGTALVPPAASTPLLSTANGAFATPVVLLQSSTGPVNTYAFALNEATGVIIAPGQTLTIRLYYSCGSTSTGRYAMLKDVKIRGAISGSGALPLQLLSFSGWYDGSANRLQWTTAAEVNVKEFVVEKSTDGNAYAQIGHVAAGASGYAFTDPAAGNAYYRLKMVDKDGAFAYSSVVRLRQKEGASIKIYPDPVQHTLIVQHAVDTRVGSVEILMQDGRLLKKQPVAAGSSSTLVDVQFLPPGTYLLQYRRGETKVVKPFMKK